MVSKGMLASATTVSLVAESLREHNITKSVVDPVCRHLNEWNPTTYLHTLNR